MKNERGITLVELLAVILLISIISIFLFSVLTSGVTNVKRTSTKQKLQQEGHYITEVIRNEYLDSGIASINLVVDNTKKQLRMNGNIISTDYTYELIDPSVKFEGNGPFHLLLILKENGLSYEINTTFTKLK